MENMAIGLTLVCFLFGIIILVLEQSDRLKDLLDQSKQMFVLRKDREENEKED